MNYQTGLSTTKGATSGVFFLEIEIKGVSDEREFQMKGTFRRVDVWRGNKLIPEDSVRVRVDAHEWYYFRTGE